MAFNGSGTYVAPASSWNPAVANTDIDATDWATLLADISTALSLCITKDGQQTTTGTIPFAGAITVAGLTTNTGGSITGRGTTASTATGVAVSLHGFSLGAGRYVTTALLSNAGTQFTASSTTIYDGSNARIFTDNGANMTLTLGAGNVQATQTSGSNQTIKYVYTFHPTP